jgi:hypothetical protein
MLAGQSDSCIKSHYLSDHRGINSQTSFWDGGLELSAGMDMTGQRSEFTIRYQEPSYLPSLCLFLLQLGLRNLEQI